VLLHSRFLQQSLAPCTAGNGRVPGICRGGHTGVRQNTWWLVCAHEPVESGTQMCPVCWLHGAYVCTPAHTYDQHQHKSEECTQCSETVNNQRAQPLCDGIIMRLAVTCTTNIVSTISCTSLVLPCAAQQPKPCLPEDTGCLRTHYCMQLGTAVLSTSPASRKC
jgi:hypothetical protein